MELHQALIKNFSDYLAGKEVEASIHLKENEHIAPGEHVLVMKDTIAAGTTIPVPREQQVSAIGIEGEVTGIETPDPRNSRIQRIRVVKV